MRRVIFFDINGTLIEKDSRTDLPYAEAIDELLGVSNGMEGVDNSARSDHDVFMEVLDNFKTDYSEELWKRFLGIYSRKLEQHATTDVWRENVDAVDFVKHLVNKGYNLALITGELSIGAQYKLEKLGIWRYFPLGGFGEDGLRRFDIAESALKKAEKYWGGNFDVKTVIGDTVLDIKTARHIGGEIISIATGSASEEDLRAEKPDHLIKTFSEIKHLF